MSSNSEKLGCGTVLLIFVFIVLSLGALGSMGGALD